MPAHLSQRPWEAREKLYVAVLSALGTYHYQQYSNPGPHDDAEAEYADERVLAAARELVEAYENEK